MRFRRFCCKSLARPLLALADWSRRSRFRRKGRGMEKRPPDI
jgi:hypothetical protein